MLFDLQCSTETADKLLAPRYVTSSYQMQEISRGHYLSYSCLSVSPYDRERSAVGVLCLYRPAFMSIRLLGVCQTYDAYLFNASQRRQKKTAKTLRESGRRFPSQLCLVLQVGYWVPSLAATICNQSPVFVNTIFRVLGPN